MQNFQNRQVYNLFDWFGDIGGIQGVIIILASFMSSFFSSTLSSIQKAQSLYLSLPIMKNVNRHG